MSKDDRARMRARQRMIERMEAGKLLAGAGVAAGGAAEVEIAERKAELRRWVARISWGLEHMDRLDRAQAAADAAWDRLEAEDPDGEDEPPEQAVVDRLLADVDALIEHGRWPQHLHWSL